jgi:ATP-binding cassette subfamily C protein
VVVRYGERRVLDGASLVIPAGRITALHGPSGSGKTTLVDLVAGLVHPESGAVLVDGVPLPELDLAAWRRRIGYVPQEMFLLHESIAVNVSMGDPEVSREQVERALREAAAWEFVSGLPEGADSPVGERGSLLSGGQRQLVAIARALARRPWLLILDEATASLDAASEAALWARMESLRGTTTVLAISHQPGVLEVADRIYHVADARVVESPSRRGSSTSRYASIAASGENPAARERSRSGSGGASSTFRMDSASARSSPTGVKGP